ncbi:hypothetical protein [Chryseobacterium chendengshani]|uniref:hypothetical protein n=1 Tax=unclassified Chryseobacterium TaxID=2593645 RepID=UPI0035C8F15E
MKSKAAFILLFTLSIFYAQEIQDKNAFKKCRKEFSKKICLSDDDKDRILFYLDNCPKIVGAIENDGCPWLDIDGDEIFDKDDACPTVAGPQQNNGCPWPDTDEDEILDKDDACPTIYGIKERNGCPDPRIRCLEISKKDSISYKNFKIENRNLSKNYENLGDLIVKKISEQKDIGLVYIKLFDIGPGCYYEPSGINPQCSSTLRSDKYNFLISRLFSKYVFENIKNKLSLSILTSNFFLASQQEMNNYIDMSSEQYNYFAKNFNNTRIKINGPKTDISPQHLEVNVSFVEENPYDVILDLNNKKYNYQFVNNQWKLIETTKQN